MAVISGIARAVFYGTVANSLAVTCSTMTPVNSVSFNPEMTVVGAKMW